MYKSKTSGKNTMAFVCACVVFLKLLVNKNPNSFLQGTTNNSDSEIPLHFMIGKQQHLHACTTNTHPKVKRG